MGLLHIDGNYYWSVRTCATAFSYPLILPSPLSFSFLSPTPHPLFLLTTSPVVSSSITSCVVLYICWPPKNAEGLARKRLHIGQCAVLAHGLSSFWHQALLILSLPFSSNNRVVMTLGYAVSYTANFLSLVTHLRSLLPEFGWSCF